MTKDDDRFFMNQSIEIRRLGTGGDPDRAGRVHR
jgi:hypothetical protein